MFSSRMPLARRTEVLLITSAGIGIFARRVAAALKAIGPPKFTKAREGLTEGKKMISTDYERKYRKIEEGYPSLFWDGIYEARKNFQAMVIEQNINTESAHALVVFSYCLDTAKQSIEDSNI